MNISQKFINIILSIIIIYLVFQFEKTKERMTLIEDITEEMVTPFFTSPWSDQEHPLADLS